MLMVVCNLLIQKKLKPRHKFLKFGCRMAFDCLQEVTEGVQLELEWLDSLANEELCKRTHVALEAFKDALGSRPFLQGYMLRLGIDAF